MSDRWKDIYGFEGRYQVDSFGNVRSLDADIIKKNGIQMRVKGRTITPCDNGNGYKVVYLSCRNRRTPKYIHRLVLEAFSPVSDMNVLEGNHINGDKADNKLENLEWATSSQNKLHAYKTKLRPTGETHPQAKLSDADVAYIRANYTPHHPTLNTTALSERFGISKAQVHMIANGKRRVTHEQKSA